MQDHLNEAPIPVFYALAVNAMKLKLAARVLLFSSQSYLFFKEILCR
jgi:hypothetical protein